MARGLGPAEEYQPLAGLGTDLQAAQLLGPDLGQPGDDGAGGVGLDDLLGDPEAFGRRLGLDPDELPFGEAQVLQARQVRMPGRADDHDLAARVHHGAQARPQ